MQDVEVIIAQLREQNHQLFLQNQPMSLQNQQLIEQIKRLTEQLEQAQAAVARQAAPFRRAERLKKPAEQHKKPGRPVGHIGVCRQPPPVVDHHEDVPLPCCPKCGGPIHGVHPVEQILEEIPPVRPVVYKIVTYRATCARCGEVRSRHPLQTSDATGAAGVHLGPHAAALWEQKTLDDAAIAVKRVAFDAWIDRLLAHTPAPGGETKIHNRLNEQRDHLLGCLKDVRVEPTNNRAERSLRPAVIARKLSSGNKTDRGRKTWETLASLAATAHQTGKDFIQFLTNRAALAYDRSEKAG